MRFMKRSNSLVVETALAYHSVSTVSRRLRRLGVSVQVKIYNSLVTAILGLVKVPLAQKDCVTAIDFVGVALVAGVFNHRVNAVHTVREQISK